jgi:hypothetical protein
MMMRMEGASGGKRETTGTDARVRPHEWPRYCSPHERPLGTVVESIVWLNTELELAIATTADGNRRNRGPPPLDLPSSLPERQRLSLPEPSDLDLGEESH